MSIRSTITLKAAMRALEDCLFTTTAAEAAAASLTKLAEGSNDAAMITTARCMVEMMALLMSEAAGMLDRQAARLGQIEADGSH